MNVSMMDSYNLAWKLVHTIHGLTPQTTRAESVLSTYDSERVGVAKMLIEFDTQFSSMFSGKIDSDTAVKGLTHEQFLKVFSDGSGFTSGCGIAYPPSVAVAASNTGNKATSDECLAGVIRPGYRLLDSVVKRFADSNPRHLQDGMSCRNSVQFTADANTDRLSFDWSLSRTRVYICRSS